MTTLKVKNEKSYGSKVNLAGAGTVQISATGTFDTEDWMAEKILAAHPDHFEVFGETTTTTTTLEELKKKAEEDDLNDGADTNDIGMSAEEKEQLIASLDSKSLAELKGFAKSFPKAEWKSLGQPELIEYLKGKL